ncbi:MAG TPA: hypothetical protein VHA54_08405 [Solirubrobacterales bacterium]|nr:hypothetical protein [Solirubrobacterales bacterium]
MLSLAGKVARVSGVEPPPAPPAPPSSGPGPIHTGPGPVLPETKILGKTVATAGHKARVTFRFSSPQAGSSFECRVVRLAQKKPKQKGKAKASRAGAPPFRACSSPRAYRLGPGRYRFEVRAVLGGVADPSPASRSFRVAAPR